MPTVAYINDKVYVSEDEYLSILEKNKQLQNKIDNLENGILRIAEANAKHIAENIKLKEGYQVQKIASDMRDLEKQNAELKNKFNRIYDILEER